MSYDYKDYGRNGFTPFEDYENRKEGLEEKRGELAHGGRREQKIKNKAAIEVEACCKKHKIEARELEAQKINLKICEEQNCDFVFAGDEIGYKVKIFNDSHITVRNVEFVDTFNECGEYKKDSFMVNGRRECPHVKDGCIKYRLNEIKPHEEVVICFEVYFK